MKSTIIGVVSLLLSFYYTVNCTGHFQEMLPGVFVMGAVVFVCMIAMAVGIMQILLTLFDAVFKFKKEETPAQYIKKNKTTIIIGVVLIVAVLVITQIVPLFH